MCETVRNTHFVVSVVNLFWRFQEHDVTWEGRVGSQFQEEKTVESRNFKNPETVSMWSAPPVHDTTLVGRKRRNFRGNLDVIVIFNEKNEEKWVWVCRVCVCVCVCVREREREGGEVGLVVQIHSLDSVLTYFCVRNCDKSHKTDETHKLVTTSEHRIPD